MRAWQHWIVLALTATCTIAAGCGGVDYGPTGRITGTLTMDGKPLAEGTAVSFMQMEKGYLALGMTDADGKFEIGSGVGSFNNGEMPVGKYNVMVAPPAGAAMPAKEVTPEEAFEHPELMDAPPVKAEFPAKYRDVTTSGLEFEIKAGANEIPIELKSK